MKFHSLFSKLIVFLAIISLIACADKTNKETPNSDAETTEQATQEATTETPKNNHTYYAWVDKINMRDAPHTKGKVIGTYTSQQPLEFTGTASDNKDIIVLRGVAYDEKWLKVITTDNKEGWVYGGAVKTTNESKGNRIITKEKFDFPHFGNFDLTTWKNLGVVNEEAGDAETSTYRYMKNNQILEIEITNVGEYGYYNRYKIFDTNNTIQKEREFGFQINMGPEGNMMELSEIVKNYTSKKQYSRKQMLTKHFMQLNERPEMVSGVWEETALEIEDKNS